MTARVKNPNTPASDQSPQVWHTVTMDDGTEMDVLAADPMEAIEIAKRRDQRYLGKYCCGDHEMCGCGGGWFNGVHLTHDMFRKQKVAHA